MPDDRSGRDKQARDEANRQRKRAMLEELERSDETEPTVEEASIDGLDEALESLAYPASGIAVVEAAGDREVEAGGATHPVTELVPETEDVQFDSPQAVLDRVTRPTSAAAMKRIQEAVATLPNATLDGSQWTAYERTLRELVAVTPDDDDEGVAVVTDWIVDRIAEKKKLPGSRDVRRRAAKYCRENGYKVRNDEWLGV